MAQHTTPGKPPALSLPASAARESSSTQGSEISPVSRSSGATLILEHAPTVAVSSGPSTPAASGPVGFWYSPLGCMFPSWYTPSADSPKSWPVSLKAATLAVIFLVQVSMNFNAAVYGSAGSGMEAEFGVGETTVKLGFSLFLILYAFGCELWAPFSEEIGRKPIMQASLWLVNLFALVAALSGGPAGVISARTLGGLSSAGGSVTLGIVADMYSPYMHQYALGAIVLSSCGGSVVGPMVGGPIKASPLSWRWIFWVQFILGCFTALVHLLCCPETDQHTLKVAQYEKQMRGLPAGTLAPPEGREPLKMSRVVAIMLRPFKMLFSEPVVLSLSLLSGFSDALVFTCFESYGLVFDQWAFNDWQQGLAFSAILLGNFVAFGAHCFDFHLQRVEIRAWRDGARSRPAPERRLKALLFAGPLLPVGIFIFAGTSMPSLAHWIVPLFASMLVGIANFAIYMTTIDYMVAMYGKEYAASATGGNGFCRDLLAGISAWYAKALYQDLGPYLPIPKGSVLLGALAIVLVAPIYGVYFKGEWLRARSKMAKGLEDEDAEDSQDVAQVSVQNVRSIDSVDTVKERKTRRHQPVDEYVERTQSADKMA